MFFKLPTPWEKRTIRAKEMEEKPSLSFLLLLLLFIVIIGSAAPSTSLRRCHACHHSPWISHRRPAGEKLIFVLAGQSNMAGRGGVSVDRWDELVPPESSPNPRILRFSARLKWEVAHEPLHADIDVNKTGGVGPGLPFAHALLSSYSSRSSPPPPAVVGLVPCAFGGTRIKEWGRGTVLYKRMLRRTRAAAGGGGRVAAVLWYHGESDTVYREDAEAYKRRMERLVSNLRSDLGLPELLVIQVGLASGEGNYVEMVRERQKSMEVPNVAYVDAMGLQLGEDYLHITTLAQVQLGQMLARAYLTHAPKPYNSK